VPLSGSDTLVALLSLPDKHPQLEPVPFGCPRRTAKTEHGGTSIADVLADDRGRLEPANSAEPLPRRSTWCHPKMAPHVLPRARVNATGCPAAPRTAARVPVEGRRAEVRRGSPRAAEPVALRPHDAVRCLARAWQRADAASCEAGPRAPPDPTLPPGPILVRPKPGKGPSEGSTTATLVEWSVVGSRKRMQRTSRESRLQGVAPSGKPYRLVGV
jgi:hypothetical protein